MWRSKRTVEALTERRQRQSNTQRAKHERVMHHRFRVPMMRLSANIVNFALLEPGLPLLMISYQSPEVFETISRLVQCAHLRSHDMMAVLSSSWWIMPQLRITIDVVIGFVTDTRVSGTEILEVKMKLLDPRVQLREMRKLKWTELHRHKRNAD